MTAITKYKTSTVAELKKAGWKVLGYYCCYVPVELLTAARVIPYRVVGNMREQITEADAVLETVMCPWVRNTFDQALKGRYPFLDGVIIPHVCDAVQRMYAFWKYYTKLPYYYQFDIPHVFSASSLRFFAEELALFKESLESLVGHKITDEEIAKAIDLHNKNRKLVKELYSLRKAEPSPIPGSEVLRVLKSGMTGIPVEEFNGLLTRVISDVKSRPVTKGESQPRLMLSGCVIDDDALFKLVEEIGAQVVMDDLPIGTRSFWFEVKKGPNLMASLAKAYIEGVRCPRTIEGKRVKNFKEEYKDRWGYLVDYARDYSVKGVILNLLHFCDAHEYDFIDLKNYLMDSGLPNLVLDDDYTLGSIQRVKTRIEAFVETLRTD